MCIEVSETPNWRTNLLEKARRMEKGNINIERDYHSNMKTRHQRASFPNICYDLAVQSPILQLLSSNKMERKVINLNLAVKISSNTSTTSGVMISTVKTNLYNKKQVSD